MEKQMYESITWNRYNPYDPCIYTEVDKHQPFNINPSTSPWNLPVRRELFGYIFPSNHWRAFA